MAANKYMFSDSCPTKLVEFKNKAGIITLKSVKGLYPFGEQCEIITDENLSDSMAEYLLTKEDYKKYIVKSK